MTWRQMDVAGASGPTLPCRPVAMWCRSVPPYPCPCHQSVGQLLHYLRNIDFMSVQAVDEIHSSWFHGPIVIHLRAISRLWNHLQIKSSHMLEMQPPLGANRDPPMQWWSLEGRPTPSCYHLAPKEAPPPLHCLQIPPSSLVL